MRIVASLVFVYVQVTVSPGSTLIEATPVVLSAVVALVLVPPVSAQVRSVSDLDQREQQGGKSETAHRELQRTRAADLAVK